MTPAPTGIEKLVCDDIAARQVMGKAKYPTELAANLAPLSERIQHSYEESLDGSNYLKWAHGEALKLEAENAQLRADVAELNVRLHERTQAFLSRQASNWDLES